MQTINEFLDLFYNTISFECGDQFKSEAFRKLFYPFAILIENVNGEYKYKSIDEHIKEFETIINEYPQLFLKGFHEVQIQCEVIEKNNYFLVSSDYRKTYCRNQEDVVEYGANNMTIICDNGKYKIASINW